jgi:hypothetical protein
VRPTPLPCFLERNYMLDKPTSICYHLDQIGDANEPLRHIETLRRRRERPRFP